MIPDGYERLDRILTWKAENADPGASLVVQDALRSGTIKARAVLHKKFFQEFSPEFWIAESSEAASKRILQTGFIELEPECEGDDLVAPVVLAVADCENLLGLRAIRPKEQAKNRGGAPQKHDGYTLACVMALIAYDEGLEGKQSIFVKKIQEFYTENLGLSEIPKSTLDVLVRRLYDMKNKYSNLE